MGSSETKPDHLEVLGYERGANKFNFGLFVSKRKLVRWLALRNLRGRHNRCCWMVVQEWMMTRTYPETHEVKVHSQVKNHGKRNHCKHECSDRIFFTYFTSFQELLQQNFQILSAPKNRKPRHGYWLWNKRLSGWEFTWMGFMWTVNRQSLINLSFLICGRTELDSPRDLWLSC